MTKEYCPHCHRPIMQNKQSFSRALADILMTAACEFPAEIPFHLQHDLLLTKSQYNNFQKLRYWGFVKKSYKADGSRNAGKWELTSLVRYIVNGKTFPKFKMTFNNKVVSASEEMIKLEDVIGSYDIPSVWSEKQEVMKNLKEADLFDEAIK